MNAVIQCLAHAPSLADFFLNTDHSKLHSKNGKLAESFATVVHGIYKSGEASPTMITGIDKYSYSTSRFNRAFRPNDFLEQMVEVAEQFEGSEQRK